MQFQVLDEREQAIDLLRGAVTRSKRKTQVPFAKAFLRGTHEDAAPLARLVQGGRGGEVRLKIYLTITMMATQEPHDLQKPPAPRLWAEMLGLAGPSAARRITSNMRWLHQHKFIKLTARTGHVPLITLLDSTTSGEPYQRPTEKNQRYISLPLFLWTEGWILELSATALALLMVIRDVQLGKSDFRYASRQDRDAYGLSPDTWTKAAKELERYELLRTRRVSQGNDFDYQRMRKLYAIDVDRLSTRPTVERADSSQAP
jgi:hypothetical protein